ncbi:MAG: efflux RND transporter periplasmic adaptor subunit [Phycisphaerales bacterium]
MFTHTTTRALLIALLATAPLTLTACKKGGTPQATAGAGGGHSDHDGHDHGHGEAAGEGGEHVDETKLLPDAIKTYGITLQPAQRWVLRPTFPAPARIAFNTEAMAHVGAPLRGRAIEIPARTGDTVKRGDTLVVIESPELGEAQTDLLQRRTAVESAGPAVDLARSSWERAKGLYESSQGIALTEVQRREAEYQAAAANLKAAQSAATAAHHRLALLGMTVEAIDELTKTGQLQPRLTVRAPIDGQVIQREITQGELVSPDRESLLVIADTAKLWVIADVPEASLLETATGATAWIAITGAAERIEARVTHIGPQLNTDTRTAQVRIELPAEAASKFRPGMFAQVEIVAASSEPETAPVVAVPEAAVQTVEGGPAVFVPVKGEANTFAKRAVTVGKPIGGLVPILAGLVEGEEFVATGTFVLKAELGKGSAAHEH